MASRSKKNWTRRREEEKRLSRRLKKDKDEERKAHDLWMADAMSSLNNYKNRASINWTTEGF